MPGPEFLSAGAEATNAIQKFLLQRAMQDRQAQLDALAKQQQEAEIRQKDAMLQLQQQQEARQVQDSAATRAFQAGQLERQNKQDATAQADKIYSQSVGGQVYDPATVKLLDAQGLSSTHYNVPGVLMQGPLQGEDQSDTAREAEIGKSPDTEQSIGGQAWQLARAAAADKAEAASQAAIDKAEAAKTHDEQVSADKKAHDDTMRALAALSGNKGAGKVHKTEYQDPVTGRNVVAWLTEEQQAALGTVRKTVSGVLDSRLASANAVINTGNDIIHNLQDPDFASQVGPIMGRANTLRKAIGDSPEAFAELTGQFASISAANLGVHGMRSAELAEKINAMLDRKQTPESLIAEIRGLNKFAEHLMENEGRPVTGDGGKDDKNTKKPPAATTPNRVKILSVTPVGP